MHTPVEPGYRHAADRRAAGLDRAPSRTRRLTWLALGVVVIGVVWGIAARVAESNAPGADTARRGLLEDIDRAQARAGALESSVAALGTRIRATQAALGAAGPLVVVSRLEQESGLTAVSGPGVAVTIDPGATGTILDRDIQVLVNGLWSAGAEGVSIGGVRLQATSAIRQAGGAILVDNRPVFWPITIDAIGDPRSLHADFATTAGYGRFASFEQLYSIRFEVTDRPDLTLPAALAHDLQFATAAGTTGGESVASTASPTTATRTTATPTTASPTTATSTAATSAAVTTR